MHMKLQKILRSSLGFSMVEITVAMGLLGLATLAVVNLSENVNTSTRRAETLLSKSQFASSLGNYLYSANACKELQDMPAFTGSNPVEMALQKWSTGESPEPLKAGKEFKNFKLKSLTASLSTEPNLPTITIGSNVYTKNFVNVVAVIQMKKKAGVDYDADPQQIKEEKYFFNVPVLTTASRAVWKCAEEKSAAETCSAMRGEFNETSGECKLAETCQMQGTFARCTGGTCPGTSPVNNQFTNSTSCPSNSMPIVTGNRQWQHTGTCSGKKCKPPTINNTYTYHSCLQCGDMAGSGTVPSYSGGTTGSYGGGGGGGGCFVAGTQIDLYGGEKKNIEDVKVGDSLVDHGGREVIVKALKSYDFKGKIYSVNGSGYFFTPNHPFKTTEGWKSLDPKASMKESQGIKVSMLKVGDVLIKKSGYEVVKSLDAKVVNEKVYNFTVSDSHEYIADDFVVHNVKQYNQFNINSH